MYAICFALQMPLLLDIINKRRFFMGLLDFLFGNSDDKSTKKSSDAYEPWLYDDECDDCGDPVEDCECDDCDGDCEDY